MSVKIFKHEFLRIFRAVRTLLILSVLGAVGFGLICDLLKISDARLLTNFFSIAYSLSEFVLSVFTIVSIIAIYRTFYRAIATDEAYLTFTLPAKMKSQISGRYFAILLWTVICILVGALSTVIFETLCPVENLIADSGNLFDFQGLNFSAVMMIIEIILIAVFSFTSGVMQIMFAIILGSAIAKKHKEGVAVGILVLLGFIEGFLITFGIVFFVILGIENYSEAYVHIVLSISAVVVALAGILFAVLSNYILSKRLNVE